MEWKVQAITGRERWSVFACVSAILNVFVCKQITRTRPWTVCQWWRRLTSGATWTPAPAPSRAARGGSTPTLCRAACPAHPRSQVPTSARTSTTQGLFAFLSTELARFEFASMAVRIWKVEPGTQTWKNISPVERHVLVCDGTHHRWCFLSFRSLASSMWSSWGTVSSVRSNCFVEADVGTTSGLKHIVIMGSGNWICLPMSIAESGGMAAKLGCSPALMKAGELWLFSC